MLETPALRGVDVLVQVEALLQCFDTELLRTVADDELCAMVGTVESIARRLSAIQVDGAAEVAERSRPELGVLGLSQRHCFVKPAPFLERLTRISASEARRRIQLGDAVRQPVAFTGELLPARFPELSKAFSAGGIDVDAACTIVRTLESVRRVAHWTDLEFAESGLVSHAADNPVQFVSDLAIRVRDRLDPDGVLPREEESRIRRGITLGRERNGVVPINGALAPTVAALLRSTFDEANAPAAKPRFLSDEDRRDGTVTSVDKDGVVSISVEDRRTRHQRQHDVFAGLLLAGIRNTGFEPGQVRSVAEVTAHISMADLESGKGVGWIDGINESVSVSTIKQLLCDAAYRKAILGNDGEILALGKARYPFTPAQKKAMVIRDGDTCVLDCDAPAVWCHAHHIDEYWTHGATGQTDIDNGVLLCANHHEFIHNSDWKLRMIDGVPHLLAPPGIDPRQNWRRLGRVRVRAA